MKIKLPESPITPQEVKQRNKKMMADDFEKRDGYLPKVLVFIKLNQPITNTEIKTELQKYYKFEQSIDKVKNCTTRLKEVGILNSITSGELMTMPPNEKTELHREAYRKFFAFLDHIPKQFRKNYDKVSYYWVDDDSEEYVEWACKLLGFEIEK